MVSMVNVVVGETILAVAFGLLAWSARSANLLATCLATIPSYMLNRAWVWGRTGRSRLVREVLPFWGMAFLGLALSTWAAGYAESFAIGVTSTRSVQTVVVMVSILATYGGLWIARFFILDTILFAERPPARAALNGDG